MTLKELLGMGAYAGAGVYPATGKSTIGGEGALDVISYNFKKNWLEAAVASTATGIGFTLAKKLTKSPRRMANKAIKQLGLGSMVRV